jgi:hypothetical protein
MSDNDISFPKITSPAGLLIESFMAWLRINPAHKKLAIAMTFQAVHNLRKL